MEGGGPDGQYSFAAYILRETHATCKLAGVGRRRLARTSVGPSAPDACFFVTDDAMHAASPWPLICLIL